MTGNKRIVMNIAATYGRSLYAVAMGLFCGRWTLMSLGVVDYGLFGLIGGLTAFVMFFFNILSGSVGRFFALAIGKGLASESRESGLEECRRWFSLALMIHLLVPLALMLVFYPIGEWAVRCFLRIPPDRLGDCVWVFRVVCISCLLSMVSVPYNAMYVAKQYIAELTIYSFVTTTLNAFVLYYMVTHPDVWLVKFAIWNCFITFITKIIIGFRAYSLFPECRFRASYAFDWTRYRQMLSYTGWNSIGSLAYMLRGQGLNILVNKFFGPSVNASMGIANSASGHAMSLAGAMQGALYPVITTAVGAKDYDKARKLSFMFCKYDLLLSLAVILPLSLELPYVMKLWLRDPPEYAVGLCLMVMIYRFIDKHSLGHAAIVAAEGRIKWYQICLGVFSLSTLPLAWLFCSMGCNVYGIGVALIISWTLVSLGRVLFAKILVMMSIRKWLADIVLPVYLVIAVSLCIGVLPRFFMAQSLARLCWSSAFVELPFLFLAWHVAFSTEEREFVRGKIKGMFNHG